MDYRPCPWLVEHEGRLFRPNLIFMPTPREPLSYIQSLTRSLMAFDSLSMLMKRRAECFR